MNEANNKQTIRITRDEEIERITPILIKNGYTVRLVSIKKPNTTKKRVIEYWEDKTANE